jgi:hypothetical protein
MNVAQLRRSDDAFVRRYEYDDETVVVADLGTVTADGTVDVVGDTAIVVTGDETIELTAETEDPQAFINNGVLTIEVGQ